MPSHLLSWNSGLALAQRKACIATDSTDQIQSIVDRRVTLCGLQCKRKKLPLNLCSSAWYKFPGCNHSHSKAQTPLPYFTKVFPCKAKHLTVPADYTINFKSCVYESHFLLSLVLIVLSVLLQVSLLLCREAAACSSLGHSRAVLFTTTLYSWQTSAFPVAPWKCQLPLHRGKQLQ